MIRRSAVVKAALAVALAGASAGCKLNMLGKDDCVANVDCLGGYTCVQRRCVRDSADAATGPAADAADGPAIDSTTGVGGAGGAPSHTDADVTGRADAADGSADSDGRLPETCAFEGVVGTCPGPRAADQCSEKYCGGRLWLDQLPGEGHVLYRINDPDGLFSAAYKAAIRDGAVAWSQAVHGLVTFAECTTCTGRFVSVVPGQGDGIVDPGAAEQLLPLPIDANDPGRIPRHRIAHQWGHVIGLDDVYRRPDRDRHARFDPTIWCGAAGGGLPPLCAYDPLPTSTTARFASATFGVYDEKSKMNGLPTDGICGADRPDEQSAAPTPGDVSAVDELYFSGVGWPPIQPVLPQSAGPPTSLGYQLAVAVDPVGGPAIAEWKAGAVEIAVRGSDRGVYLTHDELSGQVPVGWAEWRKIGDDVADDPALAFSAEDTLHLAVRAGDGTIRLRTRRAGTWGAWTSLGAPPAGAASAPALAAHDGRSLMVFVRGGDDLIYQRSCADAAACAGAAPPADAWSALPASLVGGFRGKPSAAWLPGGSWLFVSAVGGDNNAWVIGSDSTTWGTWLKNADMDLGPSDPDPGVAVAATDDNLANLTFYARDRAGVMLQQTYDTFIFRLGGLLASAPAAVAVARGQYRVDIVALVDDHGHPGVWWKSFGGGAHLPCHYNAPGTCGVCGCGGPNQSSCDLR